MKFSAALLALGAASVNAEDWAVIVAGSKTYGNYRHQSDACHAYKIAIENGAHPDRVITMIYDDVANNPRNPFPGTLYNKPTAAGTPGVNVYDGCHVDYKGDTCTAENFMKILTGDESAGGKVLKSTKDDRVFVNFADHGGVGIVAMPVGPYLHVKDLNDALKTMHQKQMYSKLVFYMEACEAGSMFEGVLPDNINIYATTASNAKESSWGTYCPPQDKVDGKSVGSCLGDLYSVNWMENAEELGMNQTIKEQMDIVTTKTTRSHVMRYGDKSIEADPIGYYEGGFGRGKPMTAEEKQVAEDSAINSRDIELHLAYYEYLRADKRDPADMKKKGEALKAIIDGRTQADELFRSMSTNLAGENGPDLFGMGASVEAVRACDECCKTLNGALQEYCGGYTDYSFTYSRVVVNMCNHVHQDMDAAAKLVENMKTTCQ